MEDKEIFDEILLELFNAVYKENTVGKWTKGCILPFLEKIDFGFTQNYRGIT